MVDGAFRALTATWLLQPTPSISNIEVNQEKGTITITGDDFAYIDWIADGATILTQTRNESGNTIILPRYLGKINRYIRAQLRSDTGIAFTQPFGISR